MKWDMWGASARDSLTISSFKPMAEAAYLNSSPPKV